MKTLVFFLLLALAGCAASADIPTVLSQPLDSTLRHQLKVSLHTGRVKVKGPVVVQMGGSGNVATATDASKAKASVAAAPHAAASETTPSSGPPWWCWPLVATLAFVGGWLVRSRLRVPI